MRENVLMEYDLEELVQTDIYPVSHSHKESKSLYIMEDLKPRDN